MKEIIDLSSDESTSSKVTTSSIEVDDNKRKRNEKEVEDSSPSKIKKEDVVAPIVDEIANESKRVVNFTYATNYQSTIKKKLPLEDDDTVLTVVTERVVVSSPKKKIDDLVSHMNCRLENIMKVGQDSKEANQPPWWYNLATDIGDDIISKLTSKESK